MADRYLKAWHGEDLSPEYDLTDMVVWEECEFGLRAWNGESTSTTIVLRDEQSETSHADNLPGGLTAMEYQARNVFEFGIGTDVIWRGRLANQSYDRGRQVSGRARESSLYLEDPNIDFRGIVVHQWGRPAETDVARVLALASAYMNGDPRATFIVDTTLVDSGNTVNLPARLYEQTDPQTILQEIATFAGKIFYLRPRATTGASHTHELVYDLPTAVVEACPFTITDDHALIEANPTTHFFPQWITGSAAELNAQDTISGAYMFYGSGGEYAYSFNAALKAITAHWEEVLFDDSVVSEAEAEDKVEQIIEFRRSSQRTVNVSIGPLDDSQVVQLKNGQRIDIQAMAVPWADDQSYSANIGQLKITTPLPGVYFAHMQLDRPMHLPAGNGTPGTPDPPSPGTAASCLLDASFMTQIATPNGGFETGLVTNWTPGAIGFHGVIGPGTGGWEGSYYYELNGASSMVYNGITGYSFEAGTTYVFRCRAKDANSTTFMRVTDTAVGANYADVSITSGALWEEFCLEWTPGSTTTGVKVAFASDSGLDNFSVDDLRIYTGGAGDTPNPIGESDEGSPGTSGIYMPIDAVIPHGNLSGDFEYHDADQVSIDDAGGYFTATDVEGALQEIGAGGVSGSITVEEADGSPSVASVTTIVFDGPTVTDDTGGQVTVTAAASVHAHGSPATGFHGVLVQRTTDFTALNSNDANPEFDTEIYDTDGAWVVGSPKIFTVPASWDGLVVQVGAWVGFESDTSGFAETKIYRNVTPGSISTTNDDKLVPGGVAQHYPAGGYNTFIAHVTAPFQVADGDTLTIAVKTAAGHDALAYEATSILFGMWIVEPGEGAQGDPGEGVPAGGTAGQVLTKDSGTDYDTSWQDAAGGGALDDLTDVTITSPASPETLRYNGTVWVNDDRIWRPVMDGSGNVITDGGTGEAIMALS